MHYHEWEITSNSVGETETLHTETGDIMQNSHNVFVIMGIFVFFICFEIQRELTLLWSKLQKRIDPSLNSLLDRCLQLGAIAKTVDHLLSLVRVIQTEVSLAHDSSCIYMY